MIVSRAGGLDAMTIKGSGFRTAEWFTGATQAWFGLKERGAGERERGKWTRG